MRNCLIMGFGRSGTSLMAGILHHSGYFSGNELYPPRESNPLGFFENAFINGINENILKEYDYQNLFGYSPTFSKTYSPFHPNTGHRWLTFIPEEININQCDKMIEKDIQEAIQISGFAYKDPRFNYTLGIWNNYIKEDTLFICMYRHPCFTIGSVLQECNFAGYLSDFYINVEMAYGLWFNSYTHLLKNLSTISGERIMFIHYEQLLKGDILTDLSEKLGATLDSSFIRNELNRSKPMGAIPPNVMQLYEELCSLSGFQD